MLSGFASQMETDALGNERFRPGTEIHDRWSGYTEDKKSANNASRLYYQRVNEMPPRKRVPMGPETAVGAENQYGLGRNFNVPEREWSWEFSAP
jgi:hypothetical protein